MGRLEKSYVVSTRVVAGKTSERWQTRSCASCGPSAVREHGCVSSSYRSEFT